MPIAAATPKPAAGISGAAPFFLPWPPFGGLFASRPNGATRNIKQTVRNSFFKSFLLPERGSNPSAKLILLFTFFTFHTKPLFTIGYEENKRTLGPSVDSGRVTLSQQFHRKGKALPGRGARTKVTEDTLRYCIMGQAEVH
jgi:hypothetical protein